MIAFSVKTAPAGWARVAGAFSVLTDETDPEVPRGRLVSKVNDTHSFNIP